MEYLRNLKRLHAFLKTVHLSNVATFAIICMESLGHTIEKQGHIPMGRMSVQFFLKDLRESVDNQYLQNKCETVEWPVTSRIWFQWSSRAVSHDSEEWDLSSDSTSETGELSNAVQRLVDCLFLSSIISTYFSFLYLSFSPLSFALAEHVLVKTFC